VDLRTHEAGTYLVRAMAGEALFTQQVVIR
jgi:hypothetical protein